jgi:ABC-type multidrug transport system ATPase subunit
VSESATAQESPIIVVNNLVKQFGPFAALRTVNASFEARRIYAILGDNGAGKTTLIRILAGLNQPTRGSVCVMGSGDLHSVRAQIGYMAHPSLLYDEMSGIENLRYFARLYGIQDDRRCEQAIEAVRLDPKLLRPVGQYSQGMRQRISLARALVNDPKIVFLDEPFSNVDIGSANEMVKLLVQMRDQGKTIFIITHQAALVEGAADEFIWMETGQIMSRTRSLHMAEAR